MTKHIRKQILKKRMEITYIYRFTNDESINY